MQHWSGCDAVADGDDGDAVVAVDDCAGYVNVVDVDFDGAVVAVVIADDVADCIVAEPDDHTRRPSGSLVFHVMTVMGVN